MLDQLKSIARVKCPDIFQALLIFLTIWMLLYVGIAFYFTVTSADEKRIVRAQQEYFKQLEQEESVPAAQRAWNRLHRKHGQPGAVVYEPGKTPYYINAAGRRCPFL